MIIPTTPTSKQRVIEAINHKQTDKIPFTLYLEEDLHQRLVAELGPRQNWPCPDDDLIRILWPVKHKDVTQTSCLDMFGCPWILTPTVV